jgi:hypothetical protein
MTGLTDLSLPGVYCKSCKNPRHLAILLPHPIPPGIFQVPPEWPKPDWKAHIACHECGLVFEYQAPEVHLLAFDILFLNQLRIRPRFYSFCVECVEADCQLPITIYFYTGPDGTKDAVLKKILSGDLGKLCCALGHSANTEKAPFRVVEEKGPIG